MKFVILAVLLAFLIAFIVMVVKAARDWRWYHITSAVIAMLLAILLLFPTAGTLKRRQEAHKIREDLEAELAQVEARKEQLLFGDANDPTGGEGYRPVALELSMIGTEAGRRWRSMQLSAPPTNGQFTLRAAPKSVVPGQVQDDADAAADGPLIPEGLVVYGFAEGNFPEVESTVPRVYLGEFKVVSSQPNSVTITPTVPLEPNQMNFIGSGNARSWSLYEMLPLDGHSPFIAEGSKPDDDNVLGRVDDKLVRTILKGVSPELLESYLKDGTKGEPEDPAARWVKIKFEKKHTVDVDSPDAAGALDGGFFDVNGRSLDSRLKRSDGGSVTFNPGETVVVVEEQANDLINDKKVASIVDTYYLRPLNDYRYVLRKIRLQINDLNVRIADMQRENKILDASTAMTVSVLEKGQIEKLNLEKDLAQYQVENARLNTYFNEVREELRQMKETSSQLYRNNFELLRQIQQLSANAAMTDT